jgi:diguanylate cyclase (GGDEF)-like protein/PAS domain S-box-containing protein
LRALAGYADRLNLESLGKAPHIPRAFRSRQPDDLDQIADALDRMRQRLLEDIAQLDRARETSEKLSRAVEASPAPVLIADASGRVEYVNQALTTVTGFDTEDCIGMSGLGQGVGLLPDSVPGLPAGEKIVTAVRREGEWRGELLCRRKDASTYWQYLSVSTIRNEQGDITHFLAVMEDITALKQYEDRLLQQSSFDQLTRLPNRLLAYDRLSQALQLSEQDGGGVAVASIALDDFSNLNASLGLAAGDAVLVQVAERLRRTVPEGATVARMGGDEFLVLLPDVHSSVSAEILLKRTLLEFAKPFEVDSEQITLHASAGIAMHPGDGHTPDELLRNAASAMHEAKRQPGLSTHFYQAGMNAGGRSRMLMASRLQDVARNGELQLHYQPIVVPATGETAFMEALVRWQSPEFGAVSPVDFIDLAERSGAIVEIGEWILKKACEDAVTWRAAGKSWGVSVNLSPVQFREPGFHDVVKRALQESDLPAAALKLELTEQMLLHDSEAVLERFQRIREMGVQFSIDDFGTGYSSLSYLKTFPFDWLKIDRAFIRDLPNSESDRVLAQVIISMAHTFGMQVVAEGVEDHEHVELLGEYGCDFLQGYFFSRPRPLVDFLSADEDRAG